MVEVRVDEQIVVEKLDTASVDADGIIDYATGLMMNGHPDAAVRALELWDGAEALSGSLLGTVGFKLDDEGLPVYLLYAVSGSTAERASDQTALAQ